MKGWLEYAGMLVGCLVDDGWTQRLSNKQIRGTSETRKVNFETSQLHSRIRKIMQGPVCLPLRIQLLNMAMGGKWMFIPLRKIWYNWLWNGLSHPHVKWNLHDIPMTNPPPVKFTIAYRDSKSRPLCAIKKLKLKDANAKTPDANAANLWFGQGPTGDKFSLPVLLLDGRSR